MSRRDMKRPRAVQAGKGEIEVCVEDRGRGIRVMRGAAPRAQ
jgi:hypothetical protein